MAFDVDPYAIAVGQELEKQDPRFRIVHRPFGDIGEVLKGENVVGAMIDIGFSSPQASAGGARPSRARREVSKLSALSEGVTDVLCRAAMRGRVSIGRRAQGGV